MMPHLLRTAVFVSSFLLISAVHAAGKPTGDSTILPPDAELEELWDEGEFTEGVAVAPDGTIYFSDIAFNYDDAGRVMKFDPQTGQTTIHCPRSGKSNGLMFDRRGRLLACCGANNGARALCEITPQGNVNILVSKYEGKRFNSPNDLVIHPEGAVYFSDPRYVGPEPMEMQEMSVYRYDADEGSLARVTSSQGVGKLPVIEKPNGVHVSPDGKTLYVAETNNGSTDVTQDDANTKRGRMTLNAIPINKDGSLGRKRVLVDFGKGPGTDGMAIDVKGNIYAAVRADDRHGIIVYSPEGQERAYIPTEDLPTNCCFGRGDEAKTLYVTAGTGLYRIRLKVRGFHPATAEQPAD